MSRKLQWTLRVPQNMVNRSTVVISHPAHSNAEDQEPRVGRSLPIRCARPASSLDPVPLVTTRPISRDGKKGEDGLRARCAEGIWVGIKTY